MTEGMKHLRHGGSKRPYLLSFRSSKAFIVFVVSYAVFTDQFVFAVIVPVMPFAMQAEMGISEANIQYWVAVLLAVYGAASFASSPLTGWLTDRTPSRRAPFLLGLLLIAGANTMIWLAPNIALQLVGRVLQGLAAAVVWITGMAMIADTVGQEDVGQYVAYLGIALMTGTPFLGGLVFAKAGYDAFFMMTLGLIGTDILLRLVMIERKAALEWMPTAVSGYPAQLERSRSVHRAPAEVGQNTRVGDAEDITADREGPWLGTAEGQPATEVTSLLGKPRRRVRLPAVLTLLSSWRLLSALWGSVAVGAIFIGLEAVLPLQTKAMFGWSSIGAGLIFLPLTIPTILGPVVGWACDRYGPRWPTSIDFILLCPVLTLLRFVDHNTLDQKALFCSLLTLVGCCFTLTIDPLMAEVAYVVEQEAKHRPERYGSGQAYAQAFALFNMAFSVGNTVGPLYAGLVRDAAGWATMSWTLGLLGAVTVIPTAMWCGGWVGKQDIRWQR